jgi:glycopeptide antibiotics resistance protein
MVQFLISTFHTGNPESKVVFSLLSAAATLSSSVMTFGEQLFDFLIATGDFTTARSNWGQLFAWIGGAMALGLIAAFLVIQWVRCPILENGPWPSRTTYILAALFFTGIALYGSFVPWHFRPTGWQSAVDRFAATPYLNLGIGSRADWVANILLFIPLSFCWMGSATLGSRSQGLKLGAYSLLMIICVGLSLTVEFLQIWFPPRTVSQNDVLAESLGGVVGALAWLAMGERLTNWVHTFTRDRQSANQLTWILQLYCLGLLIYSVLPLDLTISLSEIARKYRDGKIQILPFADWEFSLLSAYQLFLDAIVFLPVGMLAATWNTSLREPVRPIWKAVCLAGLFPAAIECAQILVFTRHSSVSDVVIGMLGAAAGAWGISKLYGQQGTAPMPQRSSSWFMGWVLAGLCYVAILFVVFCAPLDHRITSAEELKERYFSFYQIPFARLYWGSEFNATGQVLRKTLFFAPLGILSCLAVNALNPPRRVRAGLLVIFFLLSSLAGFGVEMAQVFFPEHFPDATDVILYAIGVFLGIVLSSRVLAAYRAPRPGRSTQLTPS